MPPGDSAALGQALSDPPSEPPRAQGTANTRAGVSTEPPIRPRCPCPAVPGGPGAGMAEGEAARPQDADTCFGALSSLWGTCLLDTLPQCQAEQPARRPSPVMHPTPPYPTPPPRAPTSSHAHEFPEAPWPFPVAEVYEWWVCFYICSWGKVGFVFTGIQPHGGSREQKALGPIPSRAGILVGPGVWACP